MRKKILFVAYGGGHARMLTPVMHALKDHPDLETEAVALTAGGPIFRQEKLPFKGYRDYIGPQDAEALAWGRKLAARWHSPETGIEEAESIAYLGLSYWDLVLRHGEAEAADLWAAKGRHAFLQLSVFERILDAVRPDLVVTTNSPRSERAAVEVANRRGIPTLALVDLFGLSHLHRMEADYIGVLSERTITYMQAEGVTRPREAFHITGNPAFDRVFEHAGPVDYAWRRAYFPGLPDQARALLWADIPAYRNLNGPDLYLRSDEELVRDLDTLAAAAQDHGACLLVRPHPSQPRALYDAWLKQHAHPHVFYAGGVPLYPLLNAIDVVISHGSTVAVEALLMQRRVLHLKYYAGTFSDMPLGEWKLAWLAEHDGEVSPRLREALTDDAEAARMQQRTRELLHVERSTPKVVQLIRHILAGGSASGSSADGGGG